MPLRRMVRTITDKYQVVLACSATATATYFIIQDVSAKELLKDLTVSFAVLRNDYDDMLEFIDRKNLREEFLEFTTKKENKAS